MKTTERQEVLRAVIGERLADVDENVLRVLDAVVTLEEGNSNEAEEIRAIKIKEDTDGKVSAKSFKLYNLMKVSFYDLAGFLLKESTILLTKDTRVKVIMSLLNLVYEFWPKLNYAFNDQDAKILLNIWQQGKKEVTAAEIAGVYQQSFGQDIDPDRVARSLEFFHKLKVLKYKGDGKYQARERMTYERN